jgi:beta-lactamase class A
MASVLKIPVLAEAFRQLERGHFQLDDRWTLQESHKNRGSGILPFFEPGLTPSLHDLLTLMIIISDNTATDMVIHRLGGPQAIEQAMHSLGLTDIALKMDIKTLLNACLPPVDTELDEAAQQRAFYETGFQRDSISFARTPENDVSTPAAMTELVRMIYQGEVAGPEATDQMLAILLKQQFNVRLSRFLPAGTKFAHKTGTLGGTRNDSGLLYVNDNSHVALTLYVIWNDAAVWGDPIATQERIFAVETAMGKIGRRVYEYFGGVI